MAKQNTDQIVNNYYPEAVVVFITLDKEGKPIKDLSAAHTVVPDIQDIQEIQTALGSTGKTGKFTIKINNANNKYCVKDDMVKEIKNLKEGKALTWISDKLESQTVSPEITWENSKDFLNNVAYNRIYMPPAADDNYVYVLFQDGKDAEGVPIFRYRRIPKDEMETYDYAKEITAVKENREEIMDKDRYASRLDELAEKGLQKDNAKLKRDAEMQQKIVANKLSDNAHSTVKLSTEQIKNILKSSRQQSSFFEEFGGQLEHGRCVFEPMQLCVILMSRRFKDENDPDDMIVMFTGYVDSVSDEFDNKTQTLNIQGSDVTKLMQITLANINPSIFEAGLPAGGQYRIWGNIFSGMLGWQIIKVLTIGGYDAAKHRVYGAGYFDYVTEVNPRNSARENRQTASKIGIVNGMQLGKSDVEGKTRSKLDALFFTPRQVHLQVLPFEASPKGFADYSAYKKIFKTSFQNWQNEYRNHLEIANEVAKLTNYEFYADQFGDIWYHQPRFHNYHLLTADEPEVYILRDDDIINYNFSESDNEVVTSVYVTGQPNYIEITPQIVKMTATYEDASLVRKYGRRYIVTQHPYITESANCFYYAKSILMRLNAGRFVGKVTLLGRPEIRMHMPVYVPMRNMIYYIAGIQHQFKFGGTFQTTLTLKYGHKPWEILPEILDYRVQPNLSAEDISREQVDEIPTDKEIENNTGEINTVTPYSGPNLRLFNTEFRPNNTTDAIYTAMPPYISNNDSEEE